MEEPFIIYIDGKAYWVCPESDILKPCDYYYA